MLEALSAIAKEVGKTTIENPSAKIDPDKRLDVQDKPKNFDFGEKRIDPDRRIESQNYGYDDNGKIYKHGDNLLPNNKYELNGYKYETDSKGRTVSVEGELQLKEEPGYKQINPNLTLEKIGKGDERKETDDRGHLIGNRFNGKGDVGNLTAQDSSLNRGDINKLEQSLASEIQSGNDVYLKIDVDYPKDSHRPSSYTYAYTIGNETAMKTFLNEGKQV